MRGFNPRDILIDCLRQLQINAGKNIWESLRLNYKSHLINVVANYCALLWKLCVNIPILIAFGMNFIIFIKNVHIS